MKWFKNNLLLTLFALGVIFILISIKLHDLESSKTWVSDLAKAIMGLSFTVIFGGIVKLIFDKYQEEKKHNELARERDRRLNDKIKDFKLATLNQLRKVYDSVDSARLIMEAHKSARTYSEKMQENIYPSIVSLFEIKRSLLDSENLINSEKLLQLRINIHYMIAYLQALANEYKDKYPVLSHKQFIHEKLKEKDRENIVGQLMQGHPKEFFTDKVLEANEITSIISAPPEWIWNSILELKHMGLFIKDDFYSPYRKMFVDFYENSKKILKDQPAERKKGTWYLKKHEERMLEIDGLAKTENLKSGDSLVTELVKYLDEEKSV